MKLERDRLSQMLADRLQERIIKERLAPGSQLPTEIGLMELYDVSRTVVREAAAILASRGLVEVRPRRGMTVKAADSSAISGSLMALLTTNQVRSSQLVEVRRTLGTAVARNAALERTEDDIKRLEDCLAEASAAAARNDQAEAWRLDTMFDELLAEATHNPFYVLVSSPVTSMLRDLYEDNFGYLALHPYTFAEHRQILDAVIAKDPGRAELAFSAHLFRLNERVAELLAEPASRKDLDTP